jgi:type IV pilus assembly protein PilB
MDQAESKATLSGLARKLVNVGLVNVELMASSLTKSSEEGKTLLAYLIQNDIISARQIALTASTAFGIPFLDLDKFHFANLAVQNSKLNAINKHKVLPLYQRGNKLFVAVADPTNLHALDDIKFQTNLQIEAIVVEYDKLSKVLNQYSSQADLAKIERDDANELGITTALELSVSDGSDDTPIIKFVNKMLLDAINCGASDLHFEPYEKSFRVRFRQDGILFEHAHPPPALGPRLSTRLKVMSGLDISERRLPQDGRFKLRLTDTKAIDFRVSTCPMLFGEKVVMRILDPASAKLGIDALGFEPFQKDAFMNAINKPQGMVLVTGPTGSGKTVTLYTAVNILNEIERNISTAEDPVEINLAGINQVNVNPKSGLTFSAALRSFLRQDPDVVMVGEIRDLETAEIATKAAQTGHMVLSTLHTNSTADTITRMINMGIPGYSLATSINLIIAQRLARRLCEKCKEEYQEDEELLLSLGFKEDQIKNLHLYKPIGCNTCNSGYKGRVGLYEVMVITKALSSIILSEPNAITLKNQAMLDGMWDLRESARQKAMRGLTSISEILRVTKE